jgi:hypothetical protein
MIRRRRRRWPLGSSRASAAQDRAIGPGQLRRPGLALEHGELVAQQEDLGVLGPVGTGKQGKPAEDAQHRQITES